MKTGMLRFLGVLSVGAWFSWACSSGTSAKKAPPDGTAASASPSALDAVNALPLIRARLEPLSEIEQRGDLFALATTKLHSIAEASKPQGFSVSAPRTLGKALRLSRDGDSDTWLDLRALDVRAATLGSVEQGTLVYRAANPDLDVLLALGASRLEELRVLHSAKAPSVARYSLSVGPGMQIREIDGRIEALDATGRVAFRTNAAFAVDSAGTTRSVQLQLNGNELSTSFDASGLKYPIVVDPEWVMGPSWPSQVVVAQNSTELLSGGGIVGDVTVIQRKTAPFLGALAPAELDSGGQLTGSLSADNVALQSGSVVTS